MLAILIAILITISQDFALRDGDAFFHIKVGEHIINNGFISVDPFSIHSLTYTPHQWLSDVIFYFIYKLSGFEGLYVFQFIYFLLFLFLLYKINVYITKGKKSIAFISSILVTALISIYYITIRPQIFTYLIILLEVYFLEYYIRTKKSTILFILPVLLLILVNVHVGSYTLFFLIIIPYLIDLGLKIKFGRLQSTGEKNLFTPLLLFTLFTIPVGIINPYGVKKLAYITLYFTSTATAQVQEWLSPDFDSLLGIMMFCILLTLILIFVLSTQAVNIRYVLLLSGLGYMSLSSIRFFVYFLIAAGVIVTQYIGVLADGKWEEYSERISKFSKRKPVLIIIIVLIIATGVYKTAVSNWKITDFSNFPVKEVDYLKENTDFTNIRLYNEYDHGGFLLFNDLKVFIDPRCDLYTPEYNSGCYVLEDYRSVFNGTKNYSDLFEKYKLEYAIIFKNGTINTYMSKDGRYEPLCSDEKFVLYRKKSAGTSTVLSLRE